ncbi:hypothetical protein L3X38_037291 [Prunus dulcis]|uniref:Uncharacterized protein n=1 Tax=Prunus dulcis TaxID=3755 RepID=A0AAD4V4C9_PRUDU|nr:hypothetical protein L3X38_037291 [Prunus dulcis]
MLNLQGRFCRNFGRKSRSLVSGPGIGVMSGIPQDSSLVLGNSKRVLSDSVKESSICISVGKFSMDKTRPKHSNNYEGGHKMEEILSEKEKLQHSVSAGKSLVDEMNKS